MKTINIIYKDNSSLTQFVRNNHADLFSPDKPAILVQIFSSWCEPAFLAKLSAEIAGLIPHAHIVGTTTSGEIMNGQVSGLRTVLSISIFYHSTVRTGIFAKDGQDDYLLGRKIAADLGSDNAKVLVLFGTSLSINARDLLLGIQSISPNLPVSGGNAGSNLLNSQSYVVCDGQVSDSGVAGVVLAGEQLIVNRHTHLGWQSIGKEMTITRVDGTRVYTIDHMSAYEVYRKYLGLDENSNFSSVTEFPLIANRQGILTARTPKIRYGDGSIGFAGELAEGEKVRFSFGHIATIAEEVAGLCKKIRQQPAESIFVYSCECRRGFLQESSRIETEPLQHIAPTAGFFTQGEYFHVAGTNQLLNATMTVMVLSEAPVDNMTGVFKTMPPEEIHSRVDAVAARNSGVLKALTHLVNTVTDELVSANEKLHYISVHDSLTGLYNRTYFAQEMRRLAEMDNPIGVFVCDLDFLKKLNDVLGHHVGDQALQAAANILTISCPPEAVIARIGGDEFAILLMNAELSALEAISQTILAEAANYRRQHRNKLLYLSVGYALKGPGGSGSMGEALKLADENMYRNKRADKAGVRRALTRNIKAIQKNAE
ncbi:FIST N-terminal domain-containing protein [Sporomusa aerivorans]|uniref:sensor domain-containing diguanylate cyclase n=1 Tax=Sporomusa aerivorans TaxID=204936 RepID=UPI00352A1795